MSANNSFNAKPLRASFAPCRLSRAARVNSGDDSILVLKRRVFRLALLHVVTSTFQVAHALVRAGRRDDRHDPASVRPAAFKRFYEALLLCHAAAFLRWKLLESPAQSKMTATGTPAQAQSWSQIAACALLQASEFAVAYCPWLPLVDLG